MTDTYEHLTDAERSADARTLRRALEEARQLNEALDLAARAHAAYEMEAVEATETARRWSALWKRAAKFWRNTAIGKEINWSAKIERQAEQITRLEQSRKDLRAERDALRTAVGLREKENDG
jgi:SMC interacting uncharacterized protein involved in chromosome segregation